MRARLPRWGLVALVVVAGPGALERGRGAAPVARAAEGWRAEFDDVCSRTQDAMGLPSDELRRLVARCDALRPSLEKLDESTRKVFSRRLEACRNLYQFVLDTREGAAAT